MWGSPKTHQHRSVPIPRVVTAVLTEQMAGREPDDLVFPAPRGGPLRVRNFRRDGFDRAAKSVGLAGLVPHELRHTAAALAIASGATVRGVQSMLGNASAAMTLNVYGGLFEDELGLVADRLDAAAALADERFVLASCSAPVNLRAADEVA